MFCFGPRCLQNLFSYFPLPAGVKRFPTTANNQEVTKDKIMSASRVMQTSPEESGNLSVLLSFLLLAVKKHSNRYRKEAIGKNGYWEGAAVWNMHD